MKKKLLLITAFALYAILSNSQNRLPPYYQIKDDTSRQYNIPDSLIRVLPDNDGNWTIDDILKPELNNRFNELTENDKSKKAVSTYWYQYRLKNLMDRNARISLNSSSDINDYYLITRGKQPKHFLTGFLVEPKKKDGFKWGNFIPITLKAGDSVTVYQRSYNKDNLPPGASFTAVMSTDAAVKENYIDNQDSGRYVFEMQNILEAFMIGLLLLSTFFNLFFFSVVKEREYLYFALFAFSLMLNRFWNILSSLSYSYPGLSNFFPYLAYAWVFISFSLVQFTRRFFHIKQKYPKWDRVLAIAAALIIIVFVIDLFTIRISISENVFSVMGVLLDFFIAPLFVFITLLLFFRSKNKALRFFIIAALPYIIFLIISFPGEDSLLPFTQKFLSPGIVAFFTTIVSNFRTVEMACVLWLIVFFSWTLFIRYNELRKTNAQNTLDNERLAKEQEIALRELTEKQNIELEKQVKQRTADLNNSLETLKSTQSQLIQSEKMASLGELTAGIAHEIQNPLNFVNNFSEVNKELVDELQSELKAGNTEDAIAISNDIKENEEKINHHGKRADAIVKNMLQHSRTSTGQKEPTDINALADEYLRLSYHGMRAKDKTFNATMKTDFAETIGKVNIIPQDIGRVLLNLYNNAFYAVNEKAQQQHNGYDPTVSVSTKKLTNSVELTVRDNGNGISQKIIDKIFQPFFTTKPTGEGTGLGLSLSYDIIKVHGGEIKVETRETEGTTFVIQIPSK